ncbi:MAG TPA: lipopolysaccharide assembly protein LapA domain-containing protein [Gaiellaceae bacterium]
MRFLRRPRISPEAADRRRSRLFYVRVVVLGLLVAYATAFVLENRKQVSVHFVVATARVSLVWLILLALGVGLLGGILLPQLERRRRRRSHQSP